MIVFWSQQDTIDQITKEAHIKKIKNINAEHNLVVMGLKRELRQRTNGEIERRKDAIDIATQKIKDEMEELKKKHEKEKQDWEAERNFWRRQINNKNKTLKNFAQRIWRLRSSKGDMQDEIDELKKDAIVRDLELADCSREIERLLDEKGKLAEKMETDEESNSVRYVEDGEVPGPSGSHSFNGGMPIAEESQTDPHVIPVSTSPQGTTQYDDLSEGELISDDENGKNLKTIYICTEIFRKIFLLLILFSF